MRPKPARPIPFYQSYLNGFDEKVAIQAQPTLATAIQIGNPVSYVKAVQAIQETNGIVEQASEDELANAAALGDRTGMYNCPHTGVALAALMKLVERGEIHRDDRVIVLSTAHGLKFTNFKVGYHEGTLPEVESKLANPPVYLPADSRVVKETIARKLGGKGIWLWGRGVVGFWGALDSLLSNPTTPTTQRPYHPTTLQSKDLTPKCPNKRPNPP